MGYNTLGTALSHNPKVSGAKKIMLMSRKGLVLLGAVTFTPEAPLQHVNGVYHTTDVCNCVCVCLPQCLFSF